MATSKRDYDQRVGIRREEQWRSALSVRLECGKPRDPNLLVSFVGEGSEDRLIPLAPGEYRQFHLAISAQDVDTSDHSVPIRIVADNGLRTRPRWLLHNPTPHGGWNGRIWAPAAGPWTQAAAGQPKGDTVTDLQVASSAANAIRHLTDHSAWPANQGRREFIVSPRFYRGSTGVKAE